MDSYYEINKEYVIFCLIDFCIQRSGTRTRKAIRKDIWELVYTTKIESGILPLWDELCWLIARGEKGYE